MVIARSIKGDLFLPVCSEAFSLETAVFQILRGGYTSMDLTTIHTSDGGKCYMTILGAWGLTADVDIESEKFRTIGEARFVLGEFDPSTT